MDNREPELDVETDHQDIVMAGINPEGVYVMWRNTFIYITMIADYISLKKWRRTP